MPQPLLLRYAEPLPPPPAPIADTSGLVVLVPPPNRPTESDLAERLSALLRAAATFAPRKKGDLVEAGDEVVVDLLTYLNGRILPFGSVGDLALSADDDSAIPELGLRLVGTRVGSSVQVSASFPLDYPDTRVAGVPAVFLVDVKQVSKVTLPNLDTPGAIAALGYGSTIDELMARLATQLTIERENDYEGRLGLAVLEALVNRTPSFSLSKEYVDHEIGRRWLEREGRFLLRKQLQPDEVEAALEGCRADGPFRAQVETELKGVLLVRALIDSKKLVLTPGDVVGDALRYAVEAGADTEAKATALFKKEVTAPLVSMVMFKAAVRKLAAEAKVIPAR